MLKILQLIFHGCMHKYETVKEVRLNNIDSGTTGTRYTLQCIKCGRMVKDHEQGFIDQRGEYMDRKEAWEVARAAGQIVRSGPGFSGPELYSKNLY